MDPVHIHLLLNHIPVIGSLVAVPLLLYALLRRSDELKKLSLLVFVLVAVAAIPVYLTGEPAEETVEKLAGVSEMIMEQHEDVAKTAMVSTMISGALALLGLFLVRGGRKVANWFIVLLFISSAATAGIMARTANLGGQIRHSEIRAGSPDAGQPQTREGEKDKDDDH